MTSYSSIAAWEADQGAAGGPELLLDVDCTALGSVDWKASPPSSLGGLTVAVTNSSATTWGPDGSTGVVLTGSSACWGRIRVEWADIGTDLMARALTNQDQLICEVQVNSGMDLATVTNTELHIQATVTADNNNGQAALSKSGANNRFIGHWDGAGLTTAVRDSQSGLRTIALRMNPWMGIGATANAVMGDAPPATVLYAINTNFSKAHASAPAWSFTGGSSSWFWIMIKRGASETVATKIERIRLWLLPGTPNE